MQYLFMSFIKKLNYILKLFKKYFLNQYNDDNNEDNNNNNKLPQFIEIFNNSLKNYNIIQLLDDFNHLKYCH